MTLVQPVAESINARRPAADRFAGLDHLRSVAILLVFLFHYKMFGSPALINSIGSFGWTGVDLFFVLSGFLVAGQLFKPISKGRLPSFKSFYINRSLRILPAYLFVLFIYFTVPAFTERSHLPPLWKMLTFTQNFGLDLQTEGAFSHAWSLCIEEQFYIALPLLTLMLLAPKARNQLAWLIPAVIALGMVLRGMAWHTAMQPSPGEEGISEHFGADYYRFVYYPTYTRLDGLLAGTCLAAINHFRPDLWKKLTGKGNRMIVLAVAVLFVAWWVCHDEKQYEFSGSVFGYPLVSLGYAILVIAALSPDSILSGFSSKVTRFGAMISYSVYLVHKQLIHLTHKFLSGYGWRETSYRTFAISCIVCVVGGVILYFVIERPFMKLRSRIRRNSESVIPIQ